MNDIFSLVQANNNTFVNFKKWLFDYVKRDKNKYIEAGNSTTEIKISLMVGYLEYKGVPILPALCFYNYMFTGTYQELVVFMIRCEFKRIEQNKIINYTPF
jgi:hypothetical protein